MMLVVRLFILIYLDLRGGAPFVGFLRKAEFLTLFDFSLREGVSGRH